MLETDAQAGDLPPDLAPALAAARAALVDGDEALLRAMIARLRQRSDAAPVRGELDALERILDGREVSRAVAFALEVVEDPDGRSAVLDLRVTNSGADALELSLPPGLLSCTTTSLAPDGTESRTLASRAVDALRPLALDAGESRTRELLRYAPSEHGVLARRHRFELELHGGEVLARERVLPFGSAEVEAGEHTHLAARLRGVPLEPALLALALLDLSLDPAAILERAVQIDPARREEALALLVEPILELSRVDPERGAALTPALRWLARSGEPGVSPEAWARYLSARASARSEPPADASERGALDLPTRARNDVPRER